MNSKVFRIAMITMLLLLSSYNLILAKNPQPNVVPGIREWTGGESTYGITPDSINWAGITSPVIFKGDSITAYRDPAAIYHNGVFRIYMTLMRLEADSNFYWYTAVTKSEDLVNWTEPEIITPKDRNLNFSSPGNIVRYGNEWILSLQSYPTPNDETYGTRDARLWIMRSSDLETWSQPEMLMVKGPGVPVEDMGRMIDPYLVEDKDEPGKWWCFYKHKPEGVSGSGACRSYSYDLKTWTYAGHVKAGENVCMLVDNDEYVMLHSPDDGIGVKRSANMANWRDEDLLMLGQDEWPWAQGRVTAGFVLDLRDQPEIGRYLMFFHGSSVDGLEMHAAHGHGTLAMAWSDNLSDWRWPEPRSDLSAADNLKPRLLVLTDIGGDPDDQQSMIRLMVYSNEFEIEGLIASASGTPGELGKSVIKPHLIREIVEAYGMVRDNLAQHAEGYPSADHLLARIKSGNPQRGLDAIGEGHDTDGSRWIISLVDRPDPRPVNIAIWGGQTDLAQALWRVRKQRGPAGLKAFIEHIRIYDIYDQDGIANWIWKEFPGLFYVMTKAPEGHDKREAVFRGMYLGGDESLTSHEWMETNIRQAHGPLGPLYPTRTWTAPNPHSAIKEGDTPSWFYFLPGGLSSPLFPNWGGWGGRFVNIRDQIYRDAKDSVDTITDSRSTVWRWRSAFQRDFQARMDWCVKPKAEANHHPLVVCNGDSTRNVVHIQARPGDIIRLSAAGSCDPDGHNLAYRWWYYPEAGTCREKVAIDRYESSGADVLIPVNASNSEIHIVLEVTDDGDPSLTSYRRVVILALQPHLSAATWPGDKWPGDEWPTASPESQGISSTKLAQAPSEAEIDMGDVIVIRNGYDVWHYGDAYGRQGNTSSVVRSYLTTLYGIAIHEGVISGGTDAMERCVNSLNSATAKTFDSSVKIKHLVSYTSCSNPPGSEWKYNCNFNKMCEILMEVYNGHWSEKGMVDLCEAKLKTALGGSWHPRYWTKEQHNSTSYFRIYGNPSSMAYWGYLWLHRGEWKGKQLVDPWFVDRSIKPMPKPDGSGYSNGNEGWQIHLNKTGVWKGLPRDCYAAMGACDRSCILVCPSLNLIIARKGPTSSPYSDSCVDSPQRWAKPIFDAITGPCFGIGDLPDGEWDIINDEYGEVVRVNLNKIKDWSKVPGIKMRWEVTGLNGESHAEHAVISEIKDVDGDGKLDLFRVCDGVVMRFDENNNRIWKSKQLNSSADDESRMPVVDLDGDGKYECVISMTDKTYCIDAGTGKTKWEVTTGAEKNYSSLVVGHFDSKSKYGIAVRVQKKVLFYGCYGNLKHTLSFSATDTYGHCMGHADLDGDGYDEVFFPLNKKTMAVSHDGNILWEDNTQSNHSDWICTGDIDNDGVTELMYDHDGCWAAGGPIYIVNGMTGDWEQSWEYNWPSDHDSNAATLGDFRPDLPGLELARVDKMNRIELRGSTGDVIWDKNHVSSQVSQRDWDGDGILDILVGAPGHAGGVHFSVWNGHGQRLYAIQWLPTPSGEGVRSYCSICGPEDARGNLADRDGNGREDVLLAFGKWNRGENQVLCLMEASGAGSPPTPDAGPD